MRQGQGEIKATVRLIRELEHRVKGLEHKSEIGRLWDKFIARIKVKNLNDISTRSSRTGGRSRKFTQRSGLALSSIGPLDF